MRYARALFVLLLLAFAAPVAAQVDILTGRVTGPDGKPVIGARLEFLSRETEITRSIVTNQDGRYMLNFPDGGGQYLLRVTYLGMEDHVQLIIRTGDEELLLTNIQMKNKAIALDAITVQAQRPPPSEAGAGEQRTDMSQEMLNRLPLPDMDPATIALLAAGVVGTGADSVSGRMGFSVAGMSDLLNQITLDGVILGGDGSLAVPEEGLRQTRVTTSTFDASRGGFAGGQVSMTSARGNNRKGGSFSYTMDNDAFQMNSGAQTNGFSTHRLGGSWGGPIVNNRLFYNGSFSLQQTTNYMYALAANDPLAAQRAGVVGDSIGRFLTILENEYGFPLGDQTGAYDQRNQNIALQGRIDWTVLQRPGGQNHTMTLSGNYSVRAQDSTRIRALDLAQHGGDTENNNSMVRLGLNSRFGGGFTNNLNFSFSENWSSQLPYVEMPEGSVRVTSQFEDGSRNTSSLVFGGNRSMPQEAYSRDLQISNDLAYLLNWGSQIHRLKIGGNVQHAKNLSRSTDNVFGTFTYQSLADFEANRPDRFERSLSERRARTGSFNYGIYVGDTWRVSMPLEITLGLRYDYSKLDQTPAYNAVVEQIFGRRTDITPAMGGWSPRVGFNYRLNEQGQPAKQLSGGVGLFAGRAPTNIFSTAVRQTGLPTAEQRLICIGDAVPIPDWDLYTNNLDAVPEQCADGGSGVQLSQRAPAVTLIDPDQSLPSSLRADIGYRTMLPFNINGNFRYTYSLGMGLWGYLDKNLNTDNFFMLAGENRPFYGDESSIVTRTGAVSMAGSRRHDEFTNVYDVISSRESQSHQFTGSLSGYLWQKLNFNVNYTLGFSRDQGSGSFSQPTTASNPNEAEWGIASNDRRHTVNFMVGYALTQWMEVQVMPRISSGTPFTPLVDRDINGDGARNDRAFVFDPAATGDTAIANGMSRLLNNVPGRVADCLQDQLGSIADRNTCRGTWSQSFDMRVSLRPNLPTFQRRLTVSLDARNVLTGLDQVVNGKDDMKGWGGGQRPDGNLLLVRGYNPEANSFIYQVNEGFGQTRRGPQSLRAPFAVTLSARLAVGGQPQQANRGFGGQPMIAFGGGFGGGPGGGGFGGGGFGGGPGGGGGGGGFGGFNIQGLLAGTVNVDSMVAAQFTNPVLAVLARKDSLALTPEKVAAIQILSDSVDAQHARRRLAIKPAVDSIMTVVRGAGSNPNVQQLMPRVLPLVQLQIQPHIEGGRREAREAMQQVQRELVAEQWARLPVQVRNSVNEPNQGGGGPGGQGGQGGRGNFNPVAMLDRQLANPIPVLLELKATLNMTPEQITQVEKISTDLSVALAKRREELGKRFDGVNQQQQGQIYQQMQPQIEQGRTEIRNALQAVEKVLGPAQWQQVPEQIRNPFQQPNQQNRRGGGNN